MSQTPHTVLGRELTTLRVGGPCVEVVEASSEADVLDALSQHPDAICIGQGSNLVISDEGVASPIIRSFAPGASAMSIHRGSAAVHVDAATVWDELVSATIDAGLQGLEATSGVPGTVGGGIVQNAGAYGQEIADVVDTVNVWDRRDRRVVTLTRAECGLRYRSSHFKHDASRRYVITSANLVFRRSETAEPRYGELRTLLEQRTGHAGHQLLSDIRRAVLDIRTGKGMVLGASHPSAGSFFTNVAVTTDQLETLAAHGIAPTPRADGTVLVSAATLMEAAGFHRGWRQGRAGLSEHHVLALVNTGGATTNEILTLARQVRATVHERFGIWLQPEPVMLGFAEPPFPAP